MALVKFDIETGEPIRNEEGFCIRCSTNEVGEAIGKILDDGSSPGSRFEGYTDEEASGQKDPAERIREWRCLVSHRRPDAQG